MCRLYNENDTINEIDVFSNSLIKFKQILKARFFIVVDFAYVTLIFYSALYSVL